MLIILKALDESGLMTNSGGERLRCVRAAKIDDSANHSDIARHEVRIRLDG